MKQEMIDKSIQKYLAVAEVYNTRGSLEQVTAIYQRILKVAPMDITVRSKLIEMCISQNNIDAALTEYQVLADAYYQLAQINKSIDRYKEAFRLATKSSRAKQWQIEILRRLGDIYEQRVDWVNAAEVYERLVQLSPNDDSALLSLVDLRFKLGKTTEAIETLDKVTTLYEQQNRQDEMLQFLEDMTQLRPNELFLRKRLADFYVQRNMNQEAIKQYDFLGEMQLDAGLRDDAARTIQQIIDLGPDDPEGYKQLLAQLKGNI
jgi:tetratricopeptide (TPR) repeat protein